MKIEVEIEHLKTQTDLYTEAIFAISASTIGYSELTSVIGPMLKLNETTLMSIILLAENNHYRDLVILSRPFLESIINVGFICAEDEKAVVASKKYAYQKGYRDLFRGIEVNDFKITSGFSDFLKEFEKATTEEMKNALAEYTTKKGREVMEWTPETTKGKLGIIGKEYGVYVNGLLTFAFFSIYRDVSEIIHNSYYGVRIYLGMQQKDMSIFKNANEAAEYFGDHQKKLAILILQQINISLNAILNILNQKFKLNSTNMIFEKSNSKLVEYANSIK
ncbi:DUF5677 domain-containing protein [Sporocytophaga myxococcoides]|uniref:DUF5677 domain-containing protein n=1 Tax=Sporocytophaga myxococcoides TaxID=153721 RepID=UPI0004199170|nr:DUF5677 domain-containing protein [Sporocytophaga myxococcoides]